MCYKLIIIENNRDNCVQNIDKISKNRNKYCAQRTRWTQMDQNIQKTIKLSKRGTKNLEDVEERNIAQRTEYVTRSTCNNNNMWILQFFTLLTLDVPAYLRPPYRVICLQKVTRIMNVNNYCSFIFLLPHRRNVQARYRYQHSAFFTARQKFIFTNHCFNTYPIYGPS